VLNQLYRFTPLQTSFGANMVALTGGRPEVMNLKDFMLTAFVEFREEVVSRRTKFLLNKARERAHVLCRPRHCGREYRRGHPPDPDRAGPASARAS
jgi:DNA gyrase subunit A